MTPEQLVLELGAKLDELDIPYMLTGSLASSFHGRPRSTQDIDLVFDPGPGQLESLFATFREEDFYADLPAALKAQARGSQFNIVDYRSGWKIDFMLRKDRDFSREEFARRLTVDFEGASLVVATAEDVVVSKLEWAKLSNGSERQLEDATGIVATQGEDLDLPYIELWAKRLGVDREWRTVQELAER